MTDPRIRQVLTHLGPIVRVEGQPSNWTIEERSAHYGVPGLSIAVMERGKLAWSTGWGLLEEGKPQRVDNRTLFAGASISKPVTATLALQLVDQGLVDLDTDINRYLKRWQLPDNEHTAGAPVTLRWLLSHKAGTTVHGFGPIELGDPMPTMIDVLEGRPPAKTPPVRVDKRPGGSGRYSGGGTTIVQVMVEDMTGVGFAELSQKRIFDPLGMKDSTFVQPLPEALRSRAASMHLNGTVNSTAWVGTPQLGAGGIWTTAEDYCRFLLATREAWLGKPGALLGKSLAAEMLTTLPETTFGLGWEVFHSGASKLFGHGGSSGGFQCESACQLESGDGAVVMANAESGLLMYWEVFAAIAEVQGWKNYLMPTRRERKLTAQDHADLMGDYQIVEGPQVIPMRIYEEHGVLMSTIDGMRMSTHEVRMDENGRMFSRMGPFDSELIRDAGGKVIEMIVRRDGKAEMMRPRRVS
jgi:CubicO group peptidase (beta-lactamase class C family)